MRIKQPVLARRQRLLDSRMDSPRISALADGERVRGGKNDRRPVDALWNAGSFVAERAGIAVREVRREE